MRTAVMQRHSFADRGNDLYETPACATLALIRTGELTPGENVWEPCAGRGAIMRVLEANGIPVARGTWTRLTATGTALGVAEPG